MSTDTNVFDWTDGTAWHYINWEENQPSNGPDEHCLVMVKDNWKMHDALCHYEINYVCKAGENNNNGNVFICPMQLKEGKQTLTMGCCTMAVRPVEALP